MVILPEPKTIAFGGVATGSINAQLAANTTGIVKATGATPIATATAPTTGKNVEAPHQLEKFIDKDEKFDIVENNNEKIKKYILNKIQ